MNEYAQTSSLNHVNWSLRNIKNTCLLWVGALCTLCAIVPLIALICYVIYRGFARLDLDLLLRPPPAPGEEGGGIGNAFLGTIIITAISLFIAVPIGILTGIEIAEFGSGKRRTWLLQFAIDVLSGVPSIISGMFVYGLLVKTGITGYSALAGGTALAILMIPTIARTTEEALTLVPQELRWGAYGLGASQTQTVFKIVLPVAMPGILSGVILATARATGETAPLLFTALFSPFWPQGILTPIASLAVMIYNYASVPYENLQKLAWASALLLVVWVLGASVLCRILIGSTPSGSTRFHKSTPKVKHK